MAFAGAAFFARAVAVFFDAADAEREVFVLLAARVVWLAFVVVDCAAFVVPLLREPALLLFAATLAREAAEAFVVRRLDALVFLALAARVVRLAGAFALEVPAAFAVRLAETFALDALAAFVVRLDEAFAFEALMAFVVRLVEAFAFEALAAFVVRLAEAFAFEVLAAFVVRLAEAFTFEVLAAFLAGAFVALFVLLAAAALDAYRPISRDFCPFGSLPIVLLIAKYPFERVSPCSRNFFWMLVMTFSGSTRTSNASPGLSSCAASTYTSYLLVPLTENFATICDACFLETFLGFGKSSGLIRLMFYYR